MDTVRSILRHYNIRPRKNLGQSFLEDKNIINKIIALADIHKDDIVVEIGAGLGIMTSSLALLARKVIAIEIDPHMITILQEKFSQTSCVRVIEKDILCYDFSTCLSCDNSGGLKIIGNIPYNISSQILFYLLKHRRYIASMVLMFQKEVAERIIAPPGTKEYGIPSVLVSMFGIPTQQMVVPASCFYPRPKIESSTIKIVLRQQPLIDLIDESYFFQVVKNAFSKRRKTLLNNLRSSDLAGCSNGELDHLLRQAGIDSTRRGETLSAEEFGRLSNVLYATRRQ